MGGPSGPMLLSQVAAIWHKSIGPEGPPTRAAPCQKKNGPPKRAVRCDRSRSSGRDQNCALNSTPTMRGSLTKPTKLLKSMPPTARTSSRMLRPYTATS
ncbi:DUF6053 domain-containing protein [Lysobacter enzymogenes]|uniref:DUF6053 domain-containing protein n=1 Tax=Lysobacter enzymogenes TaxID=69 RepID=UPI0037497EA2